MSPKNPERNLDFRKLSPAATAVSATGLGLVLKGAMEIETIKGVIEVFVGRGLDGLDGGIARALKQESDAGALVDAGFDKVGIGAISIAAWLKEAIPKSIIAGVTVKHLASAALAFAHGHNHPNESFRPTKWGKASMGADTLTYAAYLAENALIHEKPERTAERKIVHIVGKLAVSASVLTGGVSLYQYYRRAFDK
jgi:phosphatidylglycerophosphate synthase